MGMFIMGEDVFEHGFGLDRFDKVQLGQVCGVFSSGILQ